MSHFYDIAIANNMKMENGQFGIKIVEPDDTLTDFASADPQEYFYGIVKAVAASVVTLKVRTSHSVAGSDTAITALDMAVGDQIRGKFDLVTVVSGKVLIHYGKDERAYGI